MAEMKAGPVRVSIGGDQKATAKDVQAVAKKLADNKKDATSAASRYEEVRAELEEIQVEVSQIAQDRVALGNELQDTMAKAGIVMFPGANIDTLIDAFAGMAGTAS